MHNGSLDIPEISALSFRNTDLVAAVLVLAYLVKKHLRNSITPYFEIIEVPVTDRCTSSIAMTTLIKNIVAKRALRLLLWQRAIGIRLG